MHVHSPALARLEDPEEGGVDGLGMFRVSQVAEHGGGGEEECYGVGPILTLNVLGDMSRTLSRIVS